jgi:hypothetical protein
MASIIKQILIAGDSFAAEWPNGDLGWVNLLKNNYTITNIAQAGVGEYKILKQIQSVNIKDYDLIIVSHTSPSRVHTISHPIHKKGFHKNCDLIITDLEDRLSLFNNSLDTAKKWFEYHYDDEYQIDIYNLIRKEINFIIDIPYLSLSHIPLVNQLSIEKNHIDFSDLWFNNRGKINHYTKEANYEIYNKVNSWIRQQ